MAIQFVNLLAQSATLVKFLTSISQKANEVRADAEAVTPPPETSISGPTSLLLTRPVIAGNIDKFKLFSSNDLKKVTRPEFEKFAKNYISDEPNILFVAEYVVNDIKIGSLLVWEKFYDSTHYEVFKRNLASKGAKFERILFLDSASLEEETLYFVDYLKNTIGLNINPSEVFIMLDTITKEDRIYEYKVRASRVPQNSSEVDYDFILESKSLTKQVVIDRDNNRSLFDFAASIFGSRDLAWILALLNEKVLFFGKDTLVSPLNTRELERNSERENFVLVPNNTEDVMAIINDSKSLFGLLATMEHLIGILGGLGSDFKSAFFDSIDETRNSFSYDNFRALILKKIPILTLVLRIAESGNQEALQALSKLSIIIPNNTRSETFGSIESVTKILKFVNNFFISAIYSQDNEREVRKILKDMEDAQKSQSTVTTAVQSTSTNSSILNKLVTETQQATDAGLTPVVPPPVQTTAVVNVLGFKATSTSNSVSTTSQTTTTTATTVNKIVSLGTGLLGTLLRK